MSELKIKNFIIKDLKPIRKNFKNKNNKFSAQGYLDTKKVKIYEIFDFKQGNLREFISNHKQLSNFFPKVLIFNERFIVEEWVDGKTLKELNFTKSKIFPYEKNIRKIIELMWSIKYNQIVFDYFGYIHKRINMNNNFNLESIPIRVNHNDLTLDNIILTSKGLKIVDNEFLGCSTGWIFNIINSFLKEDMKNQYFIPIKTFAELWEIRKKWSSWV